MAHKLAHPLVLTLMTLAVEVRKTPTLSLSLLKAPIDTYIVSARLFDPDTMTITAVEAMASSTSKHATNMKTVSKKKKKQSSNLPECRSVNPLKSGKKCK